MFTKEFTEATLLFLMLFNPFLMSVYLGSLIRDLSVGEFFSVLLRATIISMVVFGLFAVSGDSVFTTVLRVDFFSFLIFGGVIFLILAIQILFQGSDAIQMIRGGSAEHLAGSVAMPFMIGPGTISASVWSGTSLGPAYGVLSILVGMSLGVVSLLIFKLIHDLIRDRNQRLLERYFDISGRISALWIGTFAIQMILSGIKDSRILIGN